MTALGVVRAGGVVSRVGAPQYTKVPLGFPDFRCPRAIARWPTATR